MKVTIDTKEDSHEDIQKILGILTNILEKKQKPESSTEQQGDSTNLMGMFDSSVSAEAAESPELPNTNVMSMFANPETQETKPENADTPPDFSSFLNLAKDEKKTDPKIEFF